MSRILLRRGTTEEWEATNPILWDGELGLDLTSRELRLGNGVDAWLDLVPLITGDEGGASTLVDSVNGEVGDVVITLADLNGAPLGHTHTPEEIGAASASHTHAAADIGAAAVSHTHTASQVGAIPTGDVSVIDVLTQAEYDSLGTKSPTTLYVITEA